MVRNPRLRLAEVPFRMQPRNAGESKASLAEGGRFVGHLARLRFAVLARQVARSARTPKQWALRAILFGLVGLSGLLVNTAVFVLLLGNDVPQLHYLIAAVGPPRCRRRGCSCSPSCWCSGA